MFVDRVQIKLIAGKGGNGIVAWRREKFLAKGGPYGGNGGRGASIVFEVEPGLFSLESHRNRRIRKAENGQEGGTNLRQGRSGKDLVLKIPYGTLVKDKHTQEILFDCTPDGPKKWIACKGGKGGKGNNTFKSSTNQAPNICTPGKPGEELEVELELKLIADVGLVGMPNAGKSTLLSQITHAKVKIGAYPFTTLSPNLSFVEMPDYRRILIADIPGILENAHQNKGLGLAFLRHIERTSILLFVIDASGLEGRDPLEDFLTLRKELLSYDKAMAKKTFLVALNKIDQIEAEENVQNFIEKSQLPREAIFPISALEKQGLGDLIEALSSLTLAHSLASEDKPSYTHQTSP